MKSDAYHPDKNPTTPKDASKKFLLSQQAKEVLKDEIKKQTYDEYHQAKKERKNYEENQQKQRSSERKHYLDELGCKMSQAMKEGKSFKKQRMNSNEILQDMKRQNLKRMESYNISSSCCSSSSHSSSNLSQDEDKQKKDQQLNEFIFQVFFKNSTVTKEEFEENENKLF
jgi:DnaJ-class molecular chaperone